MNLARKVKKLLTVPPRLLKKPGIFDFLHCYQQRLRTGMYRIPAVRAFTAKYLPGKDLRMINIIKSAPEQQ